MEATKETKPVYQEWKTKQSAAEPAKQPASPALTQPGSRTAASEALEEFNRAARHYLEMSARLKTAEETARKYATEADSAKVSLDRTRIRLDNELAGVASGEQKPTPRLPSAEKSRVGVVRAKPASLESRACDACGATFQPDRRTQHYCSAKCREKWKNRGSNGHQPDQVVELVEASA